MKRSFSGSDPATDNLRDALAREQERIDDLFAGVVDALEARDSTRASRALGSLSRRLLAHLRTEERHLLPSLAEAHPKEAEMLRAEHAVIRSKLAALGMSVHSDALAPSHVLELAREVRSHGEREDALTYAWADAHLSAHERIDLLARVRERHAESQDAPVGPPRARDA